MKGSIVFTLTTLLVFGLVFGNLSPVFAQGSGAEEFTLEEITVTAQKREENQQKVPIAMEVITGDKMKELGHKTIDDILRTVGGIVINKESDGLRVALRGVVDDAGVWADLTTATPSVAISTDGVYSARNDQGLGFYDIERVEVLFGPQSTLYSSSSPGGVINVITSAPKLDTYEASGTLEYGNYNYLHSEGVVNAPINEKMALRAAFSTSVRDGYISNGTDDEDTKSARLKGLYQFNDKLSLTITGNYKTSGGKGAMGTVNAFEDQDDTDDPWVSSEELQSPRSSKQKGIDGTMSWETGIGDLTAILSRKTSDSEWTNIDVTFPDIQGEQTQYQRTDNDEDNIEVRMTSPDDFFFKWIAGINYYDSENYRYTHYSPSTTTGLEAMNHETSAIYGNVTYPVTDVFRLSGGLRKTKHHIDSLWRSFGLVEVRGGKPGVVITENPDGTYNSFEDTSTEYSGYDYKVGLEYDVGANSMLYADFATSYRIQAKVDYGPDWELPPPERLKAYSIGSKNRFLGNKLQVNASAYYYDYKDKMAQGDPVPEGTFFEDEVWHDYGDGEGLVNIDLNNDGEITHYAGRLRDEWKFQWGDFRSMGIDVQTSWLITRKDQLDVSFSYLKDEWTDMVFRFYYNLAYPDIDYNGKPNTMAPEISITAAYEHKFSLPNGGVLSARLDSKYQSEYIVTYRDIDYPYHYQEPHHISNFTAVYANPDGKWTLTGYVKNIENYAAKLNYMVGMASAGEVGELRVSSPRTYGAILTVKY